MGEVVPSKPVIRIHHADSEDQARARQKRIEERLAHFGPASVLTMQASGGFPTQWDPIIRDWLKANRDGN